MHSRNMDSDRGDFAMLRAFRELQDLKARENVCVFVAGPYKSGTSLLTSFIENEGFVNPARLEGSRERGYGRAVDRYRTGESKIVRGLNERLLWHTCGAPASERIIQHAPLSFRLEIAAYVSCLPVSVVLKDPLFCSTLPVWLEATEHEGRRAFVFLTFRDETELKQSWAFAPFTKALAANMPGVVAGMAKAVDALGPLAMARGVPCCPVRYVELLQFARQHPGVQQRLEEL